MLTMLAQDLVVKELSMLATVQDDYVDSHQVNFLFLLFKVLNITRI